MLTSQFLRLRVVLNEASPQQAEGYQILEIHIRGDPSTPFPFALREYSGEPQDDRVEQGETNLKPVLNAS